MLQADKLKTAMSKIITGKWETPKDKQIYEFYKDGKMVVNFGVSGKSSKIKCKYKLVKNEIRFTMLDESKREGTLVIDEYEDEKDILFIYFKENGKKSTERFTRVENN